MEQFAAEVKARAPKNEAPRPGLVVVPVLDASTVTGHKKELYRSMVSVAGRSLPFGKETDPGNTRQWLVAQHPHFAAEIDIVLRQPRPLRLLLVGAPGGGKTTFARDLGEAVDLPTALYGAGGMSDSSFVGTSAQWSSARTSTPLQMAYRARRADPLIILDELDKAGHSRANGSLVDGLLAFLEPTSARALCDLALEVEVDLSAVSYIATANDLDAVPSMLRDRFRVIRMPSPRIGHAAALSALMIDAIASERGIDRRSLEPLAKDELEIVTKAWTDRSIRRLRRMIEQIIDGREQLIGRA